MTTSPNVQRVLQALGAHRTPGWQFPGHYLGLAFRNLTADRADLLMEVGPHCMDARRAVALSPLCVLADVAMAGTVRQRMAASARLATVSMRLSLARLPAAGLLQATAEFRLQQRATVMPIATTTLTIESNGSLCCTGEASFAVIDSRHAPVPYPLPMRSTLEAAPTLSAEELTLEESLVLARARQADADAGDDLAFIEHFWGAPTRRGDGWAECRLAGGLHVANRVGHIQGGLLLGLAGSTCSAALPQGWRLLDLSAQYVTASPGTGVVMRATTLRVGRRLAAVECKAIDDRGHVTLQTQVSFVKESLEPGCARSGPPIRFGAASSSDRLNR